MKQAKKKSDLWPLFKIFFTASAFTFTGAMALIPVIKKSITETYGYMDEDKFLEYTALSQSLPGVITINLSIFVGKHVAGMRGALVAAFAAALPAFVTMLIVTAIVDIIPQEGIIVGIFKGIRAASAALIFAAAYSLGKKDMRHAFNIALALAAFGAIVILNIGVFPVIIAAGVAGILYNGVIKKDKNEKEESK
ncbi:MAG: chromate transporter [Christensenellales bacterium]